MLYLTRDGLPSWKGALGLYDKGDALQLPGRLVETIDCLFNRAVIFDTAPGSWHDLPEPIACPEGVARTSLASYYVAPPSIDAPKRDTARLAPHGDQIADQHALDLIEKRAQSASAQATYEKDV